MNKLSIKELIVLTLYNGEENNVITYKPLSYIYSTLPKLSQACLRVTVNSLCNEGSLEKIKREGLSRFVPAKDSLKILFGDYLFKRIYTPPPNFDSGLSPWLNHYSLIAFNVPEIKRKKRGRIRELLLRHNYRLWQEGLWLSPVADNSLKIKLQSEKLDQYISHITTAKIELPQAEAINSSRALNDKWPFSLWNLYSLRKNYLRLIHEGSNLAEMTTFDVVRHGNFIRWEEELLLNLRQDPLFPDSFFKMSKVREKTVDLFISLSRTRIL